jgi:hypothetical protein
MRPGKAHNDSGHGGHVGAVYPTVTGQIPFGRRGLPGVDHARHCERVENIHRPAAIGVALDNV